MWGPPVVLKSRFINLKVPLLNTLSFYNNEPSKNKHFLNAFLALFWAYVGQPDNHIGCWATLMHFVSIYSTIPRTNAWNFWKKILRIGGDFEFFFQIFFFFATFTWKSVKIYRLAWLGLNFDDYPGFQIKITHAN